jgi:Mg2+ and Co2+ transporter CorA
LIPFIDQSQVDEIGKNLVRFHGIHANTLIVLQIQTKGKEIQGDLRQDLHGIQEQVHDLDQELNQQVRDLNRQVRNIHRRVDVAFNDILKDVETLLAHFQVPHTGKILIWFSFCFC